MAQAVTRYDLSMAAKLLCLPPATEIKAIGIDETGRQLIVIFEHHQIPPEKENHAVKIILTEQPRVTAQFEGIAPDYIWPVQR